MAALLFHGRRFPADAREGITESPIASTGENYRRSCCTQQNSASHAAIVGRNCGTQRIRRQDLHRPAAQTDDIIRFKYGVTVQGDFVDPDTPFQPDDGQPAILIVEPTVLLLN
jgi:hypothetical protein